MCRSTSVHSHQSSRLFASESLHFNCWHTISWVMKCIWIQDVCRKSVPIWHNRSPDALQLITLSNLVLMCCYMLNVMIYMTTVTPNRLSQFTLLFADTVGFLLSEQNMFCNVLKTYLCGNCYNDPFYIVNLQQMRAI